MIHYNSGTGALENWLVSEASFDVRFQGKCETIFCQGNGYMGIRCATEETYIGQVRNTFVAGTFNKFDEYDVTELPNAADLTALEISIDGDLFSLEKGTFSDYHRTLNLQNGEVVREFTWMNNAGKAFAFTFKKFISFSNLHEISFSLSIKALHESASISIQSGINGQFSNSGAQHFHEGEKRIYDKKYVQMLQTTTQSKVTFIHNTVHDLKVNDDATRISSRFAMDRRKVFMIYSAKLEAGETVYLDKTSNIFTTRDQDVAGQSTDNLKAFSVEALKQSHQKTYDQRLAESAAAWAKRWEVVDVLIDAESSFDQLAIRFAQYHLLVMTPAHDNRYGIGAKGLSGEGYKGHSFWDTEIFMLPFFTYSLPEVAKSLLEYRYNTLEGAHKKALENGFKGAMYPWESAWMDDGEVTPIWGAADILTGESTKIWSGFIEQHITSDVAFAIWQYYMVTNDEDFMERAGYEMLLDTGIFWGSRLEWNDEKQQYHINNVVGPDEYKEHVNNDAFTNYTAHWCIENAIAYYYKLKENKPQVFARLNQKLHLDSEIKELEGKITQVYLPQSRPDLVIPQDDTYLLKQTIDLSNYKNQEHVGSIFLDYSLSQVNQLQVSKQASIVMLMYLLEHKFSKDVKVANYHYYEAKTLHDSSLSLSTHAILASDIDDTDLSYALFSKAAEIDLTQNMKSSDHGIHSAALGGVWQTVVFGFGGVRMVGGQLRVNPKLPKTYKKLQFNIHWHGNRLRFTITPQKLSVQNLNQLSTVSLEIFDHSYSFTDALEVDFEF